MKNIFLIIFLLTICQSFGQTVYEGKSSIIIDNKKDIIHTSNSSYKKKLVDEATINAIKQAFPSLINIEEFSIQDFDQADESIQPTDRIISNSKSGKSVQWQQIGNPVFRKDLRGENRWECTVNGYVKEVFNYIPKKTNTKPILKRKKGDYNIGIGVGISVPQMFNANLIGGENIPRWDITINPISFIGINFGVSKEIMLGLNFAISNIKIVTDKNNLKTNCYGGRFQIGFFKHTINPFLSLTALYGSDQDMTFAIKQIGTGIDFLKGKFKIGAEIDGYWLNSNYHENNIEFQKNGFDKCFQNMKYNFTVNMKIYF